MERRVSYPKPGEARDCTEHTIQCVDSLTSIIERACQACIGVSTVALCLGNRAFEKLELVESSIRAKVSTVLPPESFSVYDSTTQALRV